MELLIWYIGKYYKCRILGEIRWYLLIDIKIVDMVFIYM